MINNYYEDICIDEYAETYFSFIDWLTEIGEDVEDLIVYN